mmetsp:Transcript_21668/g.50658  ORF Transcript_21668/g.50658 Transcript_21668/m.50658 type:complete len:295 (+) Transcript_21668:2318-3202(+)
MRKPRRKSTVQHAAEKTAKPCNVRSNEMFVTKAYGVRYKSCKRTKTMRRSKSMTLRLSGSHTPSCSCLRSDDFMVLVPSILKPVPRLFLRPWPLGWASTLKLFSPSDSESSDPKAVLEFVLNLATSEPQWCPDEGLAENSLRKRISMGQPAPSSPPALCKPLTYTSSPMEDTEECTSCWLRSEPEDLMDGLRDWPMADDAATIPEDAWLSRGPSLTKLTFGDPNLSIPLKCDGAGVKLLALEERLPLFRSALVPRAIGMIGTCNRVLPTLEAAATTSSFILCCPATNSSSCSCT